MNKTKSAYEKLKELYYSEFPEEKKLELGCVVKQSGKKMIAVSRHINDFVFIQDHNIQDPIIKDRVYSGIYSVQEKYMKVLGKDIDIREVFRVFKRGMSISINRDGESLRLTNNNTNMFDIDLSKPLKEQEEVCEQLLVLLRESS